jgi:hypothetical protein
MTTVFSVDSGRCSKKTIIKANAAAGGKIAVKIETNCENIKRYSEVLKEVSIKDFTNPIISNPIYITASSTGVGPECLVPCAVVSTVWTEAGWVSKNLLKQFKHACITYMEPEETV